jgi:hypothetical protein
VHSLLDSTVNLVISHATSADFCFAPDSIGRSAGEVPLHGLLDELVGGLPLGLSLLPDALKHVFRQGDVLLGLHGGLGLAKHLTPFFGHRRLITITTADVRAFTARRQAAGASNAEINRELILLKRLCTLAMQAGKLMVRPYIPLQSLMRCVPLRHVLTQS